MDRPEKIAIIGKAPSSRGLAPYDDPSWEIWTLADLVPLKQAQRWDRHFELHPLHWIRGNEPYWEWLTTKHGKPIYLREASPEIPDGIAFPLDDVLRAFGPYQYWTNTVSYQIAFAILHRPKVLGIWGVDMATTPEYREQRPSCEYYIGWAQGLGIEVVIPPEADLLKYPFLYGFDHEGGELRKKWEARNAELQQRIQKRRQKAHRFQAQLEQTQLELASLEGALEAQGYYEQWTMRRESPEVGSRKSET